jgi:hypothetical protein
MSFNAKEIFALTLEARKTNSSFYIRTAQQGVSDAASAGLFSFRIVLSDGVNCDEVAGYFRELGFKTTVSFLNSSNPILEIEWDD